MKELFVNRTGKSLIEEKGFSLVDTSSIPGIILKYSFVKDKWGALHLINFVDADRIDFYNCGSIMDSMDGELALFKGSSNISAIIYYKVFVTEDGLNDDSKKIILKLYKHSIIKKASFVPIILDLSGKTVISTSNNMDKIGFKELLYGLLNRESNDTSLYNLEEVEGISRSKYGYTRLSSGESSAKPYATYLFIAINVLLFILASLAGGVNNPNILIKYGAKINHLIAAGEYWRLLSSVFLHVDFMHIVFNMYGLYNIGSMVEKIYGSRRYLYIYLYGGIAGSICSFIFSTVPSAGASGAIFGLFGALLYLGQKNPKLFRTSFGINILVVLGFNIIYGLSNTGIDNFAHIGGLIGGYLLANAIGLKGDKFNTRKIVLLALSIVLIISGAFYGINKNASTWKYYYDRAADSYDSGNFKECEEYLEKALINGKDVSEVHALLSLTHYNRGNEIEGKNHYDLAVSLNKDQPDLYFNLGNLFFNNKRYPEAGEMFSKYIEIRPKQYEGYLNLGVTLNIEGKLEEAEINLKKAVEIAPNEFLSNSDLGYLYIDKKDYRNAKIYLKRASEIKPGDDDVKKTLDYLISQGY